MEKADLIKKLKEFVSIILPDKQACDSYLQGRLPLKRFGQNNNEEIAYAVKNVYFSEVFKTDSELKITETISEIYKLEHYIQVNSELLEDFCKKVLYEIKIQNAYDKQLINAEIESFIKYLDDIPIDINYYFYSKNLIIEKDMQYKFYDGFEIINDNILDNPFMQNGAIFKLTLNRIKDNKFYEVQFLLEKLFSLFNVGNITFNLIKDDLTLYLKSYFSKNVLFSYPYIKGLEKYNYEINNSSTDKLKEFISMFKLLLENLERDNFVNIAIDFYRDGLAKNAYNPVEQITYGCIALEALYNTHSEKLTETLAQRCSKVLSYIDNTKAIQIKKDIIEAYGVRSSYLHGSIRNKSKKKNQTREELSSLAERIFFYTRNSIIIFLQMQKYSNFKKNDFNEKFIDKALIEQDFEKKNFNEELRKEAEIFKNYKKELETTLTQLSSFLKSC